MRKLFLGILLLGMCCTSAWAGPLQSGYWVKVKINRQGVYRINYSDLANAGFPVGSMDPRKLQLRGHQGGILPEWNGNRKTGLPQIPVWISGEDDGKMDVGDYVLFYAGTTEKWKYTSGWTHSINDYASVAYLYLGLASENGARIKQLSEAVDAPLQIITYRDHVGFHDSDIVNPATMGRVWLGEKLGNETLKRTFQYNLPAGSADSAMVKFAFASSMSGSSGTLSITVNGVKNSINLGPTDPDLAAFVEGSYQRWYKVAGGQISIALELTRPNTNSAAWLNYYEIVAPVKIEMANEPLILRSAALFDNKPAEVRITGGNNLRVWGISDESDPHELKTSVGSGLYTSFRRDNSISDREFVAFDPDKCLTPVFAGTVPNANILSGDPANLLIIVHPEFQAAAEKLAEFRRTADKYAVKVVNPQAIYNEYSTSMQDIVAIRDYIRDEYNKSIKSGTELKYVLLFGAASYDFKDRLANNTNKIPLYEDYSTYKNGTFCLDDFFGYLDSNAGRPGIDANKLKLSVGRLPARTAAEANGLTDKLIQYYSPSTLGPWRSQLAFVCDDVDNTWETTFVQSSEMNADAIASSHPDMQVNKIYADAFKQISNGNTELYPDVTENITRSFNDGCLFMNYQGHGGERGWAQEQILTIPVIKSWQNWKNMPVLFTATCEFSRYDDPSLQSGGELSLVNPTGGAIALMTTTRPVFASSNSEINNDFWTNYGFPKPDEPVPTVGDIFKRMKNRPSITSEDNKFALLGDPSMRLAFPVHSVVLDSINGKNAGTFKDTLKAFSVVRIKGHIQERLGGKFTNFNGRLWVQVLDKPQIRYTLDNDQNNKKLPFKSQTSLIYKGIVSVLNGEYTIVFSVPKDISYNVDFGKILLYAHNGVTDASGAKQLLIGSSESNITPDTKGPEVKLYMNDTTFVSGGQVEPDAIFIAKIRDISGINATGAGIGRDMIGILDKGTSGEKSYVMNEFFTYDLNSYTRGTVNFNLHGLSQGEHTMHFKVWDIHNNSAESEIRFVVVPANALHITWQNVYPNPFQSDHKVTIAFEHNKAGEDLTADLEVYDLSGAVVFRNTTALDIATARETRVSWDGRSNGGAELPNGFYVFRIFVSASDGSKASVRGKMIKN